MKAERCYLRDLALDDLPFLRAWRNHPKIRDFMYSRHEIGEREHIDWFNRNISDPDRKLLLYVADGAPTGFVHFSRLNAGAVAEWGFYVAPDAEKGSGGTMCGMALDYAFAELALHKVFAQVLAYNTASIRLHNKLGFVEEGVLRDQYFDGDRYVSTHCFGLLSSEWKRIEV